MLTTQDYMRLPPWEALIRLVNQTHQLRLHPATTRLHALTDLGAGLTEVTLTTQRNRYPHSLLPPFSEQSFRYRRADLTQFFQVAERAKLSGLRLPCTTREVVAQLSALTGVVFDRNDFINEDLETYVQAHQYVLRASPHSLRWVGALPLHLFLEGWDLSQPSSETTLALGRYPTPPVPGKAQGPLLLSCFDFTAHRALLSAMSPGPSPLANARLLALLNAQAHPPWQLSPSGAPNNLTTHLDNGEPQYTVLYNGPCIERYTHREDLQFVLVLELSDAYCTNASGHLTLHYN